MSVDRTSDSESIYGYQPNPDQPYVSGFLLVSAALKYYEKNIRISMRNDDDDELGGSYLAQNQQIQHHRPAQPQ